MAYVVDREKRDNELRERYPAKKVLFRLLKDAAPIKWAIVGATFLSLFSIAVWLISPELVGRATNLLNDYYEETVATLDMGYLTSLCMILLGCYALKACTDTGKMILMNNYVSRFYTAGLRIRLSDKIKRLPVRFVDTTPFGEVIARMTNDVSRMGNTVHSILDMAIIGVLQIVAIAVLMFLKNWILALIVVLTVPLSFVLASKLAFLGEKHYGERQKQSGKLYAHIEEHYTGFRTVKAYNLEASQEAKAKDITDKLVESGQKSFFFSELVSPVIIMSDNLCFIAICVIGGMFAINKVLDVGDIVTVILYSKLLAGPIERVASSMSMYQKVLASARRVYDILDREELVSPEQSQLPKEVKGNVSFENIAFSYTDTPLITDLSFNAKSGQKIAIVGPTGGGKTTIVNLLMRFYDIQKGKIFVDGVDISQMKREDLRDMFSMVLQDTWLFNGTIYDNIAYGKEGATEEEVVAACDTAYCDHFIRTLPQGYKTEVDNDIANISVGQKQLLTIARAFLANRKILILDEATSNVDTRTEILIQKAMDKLMRDRTSFVIAHRLSTIVDADLILVINNGNIVEQGTHRDLLAKQGFYYQIYQSQYALGA